MVTRPELEQRISQTRKDISSKRVQMKASRKRSIFKGVRIQDQFSVGKQGVKPFRKRRKSDRRIALGEVSLFGTDLLGLQNTLSIREQDLVDFDLSGGGL